MLLKPTFDKNILGPEFPLVSKIKNQFYKCILIKTARNESPQKIRELIYTALNQLQNSYKNWRYKIQIDVDPL